MTSISHPLHADHSRLFEQNRFVYPVLSRRSGGISLGVNLNPDKVCNFDCIYCQVDRTRQSETRFVELDALLAELDQSLELISSGEIYRTEKFRHTPPALRRLNDIDALVPNLEIDNSFGAAQAGRLTIRGVGQIETTTSFDPAVGVYIDGAYVSRAQGQLGSLYDIERIEVLRGPQGTLYGEGSFGGVINIISKAPNPNAMEASFSGSWFDVEDGSSENYDVNAMVNLPIVRDVLAVRGVFYNYDHDGYIDAVNISPPVAGFLVDPGLDGPPELVAEDANTEEIQGGRVVVAFTPSDTFDAKLELCEIRHRCHCKPNVVHLAAGCQQT